MTTALLLGTLIKATVILAAALGATRLARTARAAVRHLVLAGAFAILIGLPIGAAVAPSLRLPVPVSSAGVNGDGVGAQIVDALVEPSPDATAGASRSARPARWSFQEMALMIWLAGVAWSLGPVLVGLRQLRSLRQSARPWRTGRATVDQLAVEAHISRRVNVLLHESVSGPMTCGVRQPIVVLPVDAPRWHAAEIRRALVHELEHIRRADWITHSLARVVASLYWFHPLVWMAWRRLGLDAERACDDAVLASAARGAGHDAVEYADQLVDLARRLSASARHPHLAMANRRDLAARVRAVLDQRQPRGRAGLRWVMGFGLLALAIVGSLSPVRIIAAPAPQTTPVAARAKFDAATIKPCQAEENPTGARGAAGGTNATTSPGRFFVPCVTTEQLIYLAYASYGVPQDQHLVNDDFGTASNATKIRGGPAWVHSLKDKYSIEATAAGATERTVLMGTMLQSLLEDRFQLEIHRDTEEVTLLSLVPAKSGFKLKPMKDGDCDPGDGTPPDPNAAKPRCGNLNMIGVNGLTRWTWGSGTMAGLASQLSRAIGVHVNDETGITDKFVYQFEFGRGEDEAATQASVMTALQDQLGLKLQETKGPRGFIVIDHIERPAPDREASPAPPRAQGPGRRPSPDGPRP